MYKMLALHIIEMLIGSIIFNVTFNMNDAC